MSWYTNLRLAVELDYDAGTTVPFKGNQDAQGYESYGHEDGGTLWVWNGSSIETETVDMDHGAYWHADKWRGAALNFRGRFDPNSNIVTVLTPRTDARLPSTLVRAIERKFQGAELVVYPCTSCYNRDWRKEIQNY